jgi:hypothetical protein
MEHSNKILSALSEVQELITKLKSGNLEVSELETLVSRSRNLYELSVVLRYKAYESHLQGIEVPEAISEVSEHPTYEDFEHGTSSETTAHIAEIEFPGEIDFSHLEKETANVENSDLQSNLFDPLPKEVTLESGEISSHISPEEHIIDISASDDTTENEQVSDEFPEPQLSDSDEFLKKFSVVDQALQSRLAMSRLDTLKGSFGLNERLQFINELFNGSSEAFSEAVKSIDEQENEYNALKKASALASQYNWDHESETVEEFVLKIKMRYA